MTLPYSYRGFLMFINIAIHSLLAIFWPRRTGRFIQSKSPNTHACLFWGLLNLLLLGFIIRYFIINQLFYDLFLFPSPVIAVFILAFVSMTYFAILPFAPQPSTDNMSNQYFLQLTLNTICCVTPVGYPWVLLYYFIQHQKFHRFGDLDQWILIFLTLTGLIIHTLWAAIRMVWPVQQALLDAHPTEPYCDACGYILTGLKHDDQILCPECGRPVIDSFSKSKRKSTQWDQNPVLWNLPGILSVTLKIVTHPMAFYREMLLYSGHNAMRRWLLLQMSIIGLLGMSVIWMIRFVLGTDIVYLGNGNWQFYAVAIILGVTWSYLGLMMVGIETVGLSIVGHWQNLPLNLVTAQRITGYASTLLPAWVLMGGTQAILMAWYYDTNGYRHFMPSWQPYLVYGSLVFAHIAGLLWFEFTIYWGREHCQYANR